MNFWKEFWYEWILKYVFLVIRILETIFFWVEKRKKIENEEYL